MTWHTFIVLYLIQRVPINYFIEVILRNIKKEFTYLCTYECKIVLLQSHHESRRAKIAADIISGSLWYWIWKVKSSLLHCGMQCFMQCMCIKFWLSKNLKKCMSHTVCTLHTEISIIQNSSLVNLYSVFHTTALFRMC